MPTHPTQVRDFAEIGAYEQVVAMLSLLPRRGPGITHDQILAGLAELGHMVEKPRLKWLITLSREFGATIQTNRRFPNVDRARQTGHWWEPTEAQFQLIDQLSA